MLPNAPLLVALVAHVGALVANSGVADVLTAVSRVALAAWAYLELVDGVNLVRRLLGLGVLAYLVLTLAHVIG